MSSLIPKFFRLPGITKKTVAVGIGAGVAATTATHPFEQAQIGTENLPKYVAIRDADGKVIGSQKNPARFGTLRIPGTNKKWEFDKGDSGEHYLARLPKGIAGWGASTIAGAAIKARFFK